jgi:hypothetical protein
MKKLLLFGIFILLISLQASAYYIDGDSVVYEDQYAKLVVTPHTATSPLKKNLKQFFDITNKTGQSQQLYVAFVFDKQLVNASVYSAENGLQDVSSAFSYTEYQGKHYYYIMNPINFSAGQTKKYLVKYTPDPGDTSEKWDFLAWTGSDWYCILTDNCTKTWMIDPWWDSDYTYRRSIVVTAGADLNAGFPIDLNVLDFNFSQCIVDGKCQADLDDIRITLGDSDEILNSIEGTLDLDKNRLWFELQNPILSGNTGVYYLYYGNPNATQQTDATNFSAPAIDTNNASSDINRTVLLMHFEKQTSTLTYGSTDYNNIGYFGVGNAPAWDVNGWFGGALNFESTGPTDDNVSILNKGSDLNFINTETHTIEYWLKPEDLNAGATNNLVISNYGHGDETTYGGYVHFVGSGNLRVGLIFVTGGGICSGFDSNVSTPAGAWTHVAVTYDNSTRTLRTYENGILMDDIVCAAGSWEPNFGYEPFVIGTDPRSAGFKDGYDGVIDELRVSNYVKAPGEIYSTYNNTLYFIDLATVAVSGEETGPLDANFVFSPDPVTNLDPENGVTSVTVDFNDTSDYNGGTLSPLSWSWDENGTEFSTDQNTSRTYSTVGDYNICFDVNATNIAEDQNFNDTECKLISVLQSPQDVSFTSDVASYNQDGNVSVDFNSFAETDGAGVTYSWEVESVEVSTDQNFTYDLNIFGDLNICLTVTDNSASKQFCDNRFVTITLVKKPKDEETDAELTPFSFTVDTNISQSFTALTVDTNFFIFTEESQTDAFTVNVDFNASYNSRNYLVDADGNFNELQPYLTTSAGSTQITIFTRNAVSLGPLPFVQVKIFKIIDGEKTQIESVLTDSKGEALVSLIDNDTYIFDMSIDDVFITSMTILSTGSDVFLYLDIVDFEWGKPSIPEVNIQFVPSMGRVATDTNMLQRVFFENVTVNIINIQVVNDNNTLYDVNFTTGLSSGFENGILVSDLTGVDSNFALEITVSVFTDGNIVRGGTTYYLAEPRDILALLAALKDDWGDSFMFFVSIFLTIAACATIMRSLDFVGGGGITIIGLAILGIFVVFTWVPGELYALLVVAGAVLLIARDRGAV